MNAVYHIILNCYYHAILIAGFFNRKAKLWIKGREKWESVLTGKIKGGENWIWFHCSSLGEFEDCCEIFFRIQKENPSGKTILTVFSPSAYVLLKTSGLFDVIAYLPLDTKFNAKRFLDIVKPKLVLFSRSELWFNFLNEVKIREIPIYLVSLKLTRQSNFIKFPFRVFYRKCFLAFDHIFCQNAETRELLWSYYGITQTSITGNTRFERVFNQSQTALKFPDIEKFVLGNKVVVLGSCLPKDEGLFIEIYQRLKFLNIRWIIVPHEIDESIIAKKISSQNMIFYSKIKNLNAIHDILLIDSVGLLKHVYRYADLALIGGGFDKIGIHNIIEPSVYGVPTAFGPNFREYEEAKQLIRAGWASIFGNRVELEKLIKYELSKTDDKNRKENIRQYVKSNAMHSSTITETIRAQVEF